MNRRMEFILERLVPPHSDILDPEISPGHGLPLGGVGGTQSKRREG